MGAADHTESGVQAKHKLVRAARACYMKQAGDLTGIITTKVTPLGGVRQSAHRGLTEEERTSINV